MNLTGPLICTVNIKSLKVVYALLISEFILCCVFADIDPPPPRRRDRRYHADTINCQQVDEIAFIGFFPCLRTDGADFKASERLGECDLLAEAAAYLAVDRVNQDPDILTNITLRLRPVYTTTNEVCGDIEVYDLLMQYLDIFLSRDSNIIWGIIGPNENLATASSILSYTANSGLITATYGVRDTRFDKDIPTLYRTLPSDVITNFARLILLHDHNWLRIATLGSTEEDCYFHERTNFLAMFDVFLRNLSLSEIRLGLSATFTHSPETALNNIKARDINIILGFFGPHDARNILCMANSIGLISSQHAWILPSYYDPYWWRLSNDSRDLQNSSACSDEEMKGILESVIFINNIKVPPTDFSMNDFHSQLLTKAVDLFPSLTEENLKPYLLRSRATNAYDAVTLLAKSVDVAFRQGGDSCTDTRLTQVALEKVFMECEFCRLYSECFLHNDTLSQCQQLCSNDYSPKVSTGYLEELYSQLNTELRSVRILNQFGQILYSQFLDGEECPINLWWPVRSSDYDRSYLPIDGFDDPSNCIARRLNLSRKNFVKSDSNCPTNFQWNGSSVPPSSNFLQVSYLSVGVLVSIGVLVLIGEVVAVVLLILNIAMRKERNVKASSPWLNVILIAGATIRLPAPLYLGIVLSANWYDIFKGTDFTPLCHALLWQYYVGGALFVAVLLVKNWRIYRIFHNRGLRMRGSTLSDSWLVLQIGVIVLPILVVLIVASSKNGIHFDAFESQISNLQIVNITFCFSNDLYIYYSVMSGYLLIIILLVAILVILTANIPLSVFKREHLATYRAVAISILPSTFFILIQAFFLAAQEASLSRALTVIWLEVSWTILITALLILLLLPSICFAVMDRVKEKKIIAEEREGNRLTEYCEDLKHEADTLRSQLQQITTDIERLKTTNVKTQNKSADRDSEQHSGLSFTITSKQNDNDLRVMDSERSEDSNVHHEFQVTGENPAVPVLHCEQVQTETF